MLKFDEPKQIDNVNGALALGPETRERCGVHHRRFDY